MEALAWEDEQAFVLAKDEELEGDEDDDEVEDDDDDKRDEDGVDQDGEDAW